MVSSATPGAERTSPPSAAAARVRRWRGEQPPEVSELDPEQAAGPGEAAEGDVVIDLDELEAEREDAQAAAAATQRVIAQALATGLTDPQEPEAPRRFLRRRTSRVPPPPTAPVVDPVAAVAAGERAQELELPRNVRDELEGATRELAEAAEAAHAARETAERAAAEAAKGREAAEQAAAETAEQMAAANAERVRVEHEARRQAELAADAASAREAADELARRQAEAAEAAHAARAEAEQAALRATLEREAAEARAQTHAEAAARAQEERSAAEAKAQELAASLQEARAALLEQTEAALAAEQARAAAPAPAPTPPPPPQAASTPPPPKPQHQPQPTPKPSPPEPRIQPEGVPELVEFRSPGSSAVITVLLGLGALVAAGVAVYEAYLDRLTTPPGIAASAVTLLLVVIVGRARGSAGRVWLEQGVLHVEEGDSHRRFDLTSPNTKVEMIGQPGARRWKVLFLRKGMAPYEIDASIVDPEPFLEALRPYRPNLG